MNNVHLSFGTYKLTHNFLTLRLGHPSFLVHCIFNVQKVLFKVILLGLVLLMLSIYSQDFKLETTDKEIFQKSEWDINYMLPRCLLTTRSQARVPKITLGYCFCAYWVSPLRKLKELTMKDNKSYSDPNIFSD